METPKWLQSIRAELISPDPKHSKENIALLRELPELLETDSADVSSTTTRTVLVVDREQGSEAISRIRQQSTNHKNAVLLCFGRADDDAWREEALTAGALACFSRHTPLADQVCLLRIAARHATLLADLDHIRDESNRICQTLLECYGDANESLVHARSEAEHVRDDLDKVRERILRAFI